MKIFTFRNTLAALLAAVAIGATLPAHASTFTVGGSGNTFTITRTGDTSAAETVLYRTVPLSAFPGKHYTATSGTLTFAPNQTSTNVTVSVLSLSASDLVYKYQTDTKRYYRLEVTDRAGDFLDGRDSTVTSGLVKFSGDKVSKSIANLVTLSGGNFSSGMASGKYLDVSYTPPSGQVESSGTLSGYVLIDDSYDYAQKPAAVSTADIINSTGATASYLDALGYKIHAAVCFTEKERDDGYQYLQIVAGASTASYDGTDPNGAVNDPANAIYKVCFELADGSNAEGKAYFPHRGTTVSEFSNSAGKLWQQKYKSGYSGSGAVVLPVTTANITTRFDAAGDNDDTWGYKDFFVRMALCDTTTPSRSGDPVLAPGRYGYGNTFYVSIPFSEIVTVAGTPTLHTDWGDISYFSGSGSNVLTFKGAINANLGQNLIVRSLEGTVKDLAGNAIATPISVYKSFAATVVLPWTGAGTEADPYVITTTNQLNYLAARVNADSNEDDFAEKFFELGADIAYTYNFIWDSSSSENNFSPIGCYGQPFRGHFDGKGHVISGIRIYKGGSSTADQSVGLFGFVDGGTVKNVFLRDANIYGYTDIGGIVGYLSGGSVTNCLLYQVRVATRMTIDPYRQIIVGHNNGGTISDTHYRDCCIGRVQAYFDGSTNNIAENVRYDDLFALTTAADVTAAPITGESATIDGTTYYTAGSTFAIGYTGIVPANWNFSYVVTGGATLSGNTLTLASADATIAASVTPITYAVHFDANGGEGSMPDQPFTYDTPQALSSNAFTRTGYTFAGWRGVDGAIYPDRAEVSNLTNAQDAVVSLVAKWGIPYIDADGVEQICADYTVLTNATGDVEYGESGTENWYVVTNNVTISGKLYFRDSAAHLILCDGATLAVTNANGSAINASYLTIYGQTNSTGTVTAVSDVVPCIVGNGGVVINGGHVAANGGDIGIFAGSDISIIINGGTVTATGGVYGIYAYDSVTTNGGTVTANATRTFGTGIYADEGSVTLGWTNPTDSITASSYFGSVSVNGYQTLTDGSAIYEGNLGNDPAAIAGKTLQPAYSITLPEGVVASGVVTQIVNTAYVIAGTTVTLSAATPGYVIDNVTVNGNAIDPVGGIYTFAADAASITVTATVCIPVPYIDADGNEQICTSYTVLTNATGDVGYGGGSEWYVVTNAVNISGKLLFNGAAHLILCDGATLAVTNANGNAIEANGNLTIYGQTNGTGTVTAEGYIYGIFANGGPVTINGGTVTANGNYGICANNSTIILGWTNPTDSITASSYSAYNGVRVKDDQWLTDGSNIYGGGFFAPSDIAGKTLRPAYLITLPKGVVASGVVTQDGRIAYALPDATVTLSPVPGYYDIGTVTVDGVPLEPVGGTYSFTASADGITVTATVTAAVGIPYIDADGVEQICPRYTVLTNATGDVEYGGGWYVVTNAVTISGQLYFDGTAHLILCDGATLAVTNANGSAISAYCLTIYGQANGTGTVTAEGTNGDGISTGTVTINGGTVTANGDLIGISAGNSVTINGGTVTANGTNGDGGAGIYANGDSVTINGGTVTATWTGNNGFGIYAGGSITLGWTNPTDSITASSYSRYVIYVKSDQRLTDGSKIYESGYNIIPPDLAGVTLRPYIETPSFTDPEGREIEDAGLVGWLVANNFTQSDINALGEDAAATDKLYECWVLNCDLTAANPGGALSITGFAVSSGRISVTVQLVRQSPLGYINGVLYLYCADDLAEGFYIDPIANELIDFGDGDSTFAVDSATVQASGSVTQTVTVTFDTSFATEKFFKAAIEFPQSEDSGEDPEE